MVKIRSVTVGNVSQLLSRQRKRAIFSDFSPLRKVKAGREVGTSQPAGAPLATL